MSLNQLAQEAHQLAQEKGWYDTERTPADILMLIHEEISEAWGHLRDGRELTEVWHDDKGKPDGFPVEMADVLIRVLDYCGYLGIDIGALVMGKIAYNRTRGHRHGGKVY